MQFKVGRWMAPVLASAMLLGAAASAHANLVTNGGFETGDFSGWTLTGNPGFISITNNAHSGNFAGSFGAVGSDTFLSQTLATTAGTSYTLTFFLTNLGGPTNDFSVSFGGQNLTGGGTPALPILNSGPFPYTEYTVDVTATGSSSVLQFAMRQDPSFWNIDDITVDANAAAVPEPATLAIFGTALAGFGLLRRRRKAA